jgi:hypothetical protein
VVVGAKIITPAHALDDGSGECKSLSVLATGLVKRGMPSPTRRKKSIKYSAEINKHVGISHTQTQYKGSCIINPTLNFLKIV